MINTIKVVHLYEREIEFEDHMEFYEYYCKKIIFKIFNNNTLQILKISRIRSSKNRLINI